MHRDSTYHLNVALAALELSAKSAGIASEHFDTACEHLETAWDQMIEEARGHHSSDYNDAMGIISHPNLDRYYKIMRLLVEYMGDVVIRAGTQ